MAEFDLVVRGGTVVDGSGAEGFSGDVAVSGGRIVETGTVSGRGRREIDVDGAVVAPGFVDIHTHFDGQATWDSYLQPTSWHGVTTAVMGNCGVGFAPAVPADHQRLIRLMEGVEDIPGVALTEGLAWDWESFPEFLDALERNPHDVDFATQVPHAALRVRAMGSRAASHEIATGEEVAMMAKLAAEAIEAGALGFSTSRTLNHKSSDGELTPSYRAGVDELVAIARAIGETGTGVLQLVSDLPVKDQSEFELVTRMLEASRRPMSISLAQGGPNPDRYKSILAFITEMNERGHTLRGQAGARAIGIILGLECTLHPFMMNPVFKEIAHLPIAEQAARMSDPAMKSRMLAAQTAEKDPNIIGGELIDFYSHMVYLADPPDYEPDLRTQSLANRAFAENRTPEDIAYDIMVEDEGRGKLYAPLLNYGHGNLDAVREMLAHPHTVPGLSDGGAHVGTICDGSFPTTLLQYWVRDRPHGRLSLPFVIARQARATAEAVGLLDRGLLRPGYKADLNVIDMDALHLHRPTVRFDLPAGGRRLLQRADGYRHTFVSGVEVYHDGEATGELPGKLVRGAQSV
ncbi:N-acyl-D-amino-acid deacylase family protein [Cumulibacter manganitolerans]|uniref:N-acyl-D-amino-acid deacylase family protein n=1 Tax=Cumulibacter manganitolerans TaxID=1884992 RepID=UPI001296602E|nr:amidohydrolase family protein [Cumulibacter manganitolerans]